MGCVSSYASETTSPNTILDFISQKVVSTYSTMSYPVVKKKLEIGFQEKLFKFIDELLNLTEKERCERLIGKKMDFFRNFLHYLIERESLNDNFGDVFHRIDSDLKILLRQNSFLPDSFFKVSGVNDINFNGKPTPLYLFTLNYQDFCNQYLQLDHEKRLDKLNEYSLCDGNWAFFYALLSIYFLDPNSEDELKNCSFLSETSNTVNIRKDEKTIRIRLSNSSGISSVSHKGLNIWVLTSNNILYNLSSDNVSNINLDVNEGKLLYLDEKSQLLTVYAGNRLYSIEDTKLKLLHVPEVLNNAIAICSTDSAGSSFVVTKENDMYYLNYCGIVLTRISDLKIDSDPVTMCYRDSFLTLITNCYEYLIHIDLEHKRSNILYYDELPYQGIVSVDNDTYLVLLNHRSYHEFSLYNRRFYCGRTDLLLTFSPGTDYLSRIALSVPLFVSDTISKNLSLAPPQILEHIIFIIQKCLDNTAITSKAMETIIHICLDTIIGICSSNLEIASRKSNKLIQVVLSVVHSHVSNNQHIVTLIVLFLVTIFEILFTNGHTEDIIAILKHLYYDQTKSPQLLATLDLVLPSPLSLLFAQVVPRDVIVKCFPGIKFPFMLSLISNGPSLIARGNTELIDTIIKWIDIESYNDSPFRQISFLTILFVKLDNEGASAYIGRFLRHIFNLIIKYSSISYDKYDNFDPAQTVVFETSHPVSANEVAQESIVMTGAEAIEVIFDSQCCLMLSEHDCFRISGINGTVYYRDMLTRGPLPNRLLVNGDCVNISLRQMSGELVYGLKLIFNRIGVKPFPKQINTAEFYTSYMLHKLSKCCVHAFSMRDTDDSKIPCDFLIDHHQLEKPGGQVRNLVTHTFMESLYKDVKSQVRAQSDQDLDLERLVVSAVLHQTETTSVAIKKKTSMRITPPSTPKQSKGSVTPFRVSLKKPSIAYQAKIVKPMINWTPLRNSIVTKKCEYFGYAKTDEEGLNDFLISLIREIYKIRAILRFSKQKVAAGESDINLFKLIKEKSEYFLSIRSIFKDDIPPTYETKKLRAISLLRLISSHITLKEMIEYTNFRIQQRESKISVSEFLLNFSMESNNYKSISNLVMPFIKYITLQQKKSFSEDVSKNIQNIYECILTKSKDSSENLIIVLSRLFVFRDKSVDVSSITSEMLLMKNLRDWEIGLILSISLSDPLDIIDHIKFFIDLGLSTQLFLVIIMTNVNFGGLDKIIEMAFSSLNDGTPNSQKCALYFLTYVYKDLGYQDKYEDNLKMILTKIGMQLARKKSAFPLSWPQSSVDMIIGEYISFFRVLMSEGKSINSTLRLLDDEFFVYVSTKSNEINIIAILSIVGIGFIPLSAGYAVHPNFDHPLEIVNYCQDLQTVSMISPSGKVFKTKKSKVFGSARIPPNLSNFQPNSVRVQLIRNIIGSSETNTLVFALTSVFLSFAFQMKEWCLSLHDLDLTDLAQSPSYEGQNHSIAELIEAATLPESEPLYYMTFIYPSIAIGNSTVSERFYCEIVCDKYLLLFGYLGDSSTTEFTSCVGLDLKSRMFVVNGVKVIKFPRNIVIDSIIGAFYMQGNRVVFFVNGEEFGPVFQIDSSSVTPLVITEHGPLIKLGLPPPLFNPRFNEPDFTSKVMLDLREPLTDDSDSSFYETWLKQSYMIPEIENTIKNINDREDKFDVDNIIKPVVVSRKLFSSSNVERLPQLKNVYFQHFKPLFSRSKHYGQIGQLAEVNAYNIVLFFENKNEGQIEYEEMILEYAEAIPCYITKLSRPSNCYHSLSIRALRLASLLLPHYNGQIALLNATALIKTTGSIKTSYISSAMRPPTDRSYYTTKLIDYTSEVLKRYDLSCDIKALASLVWSGSYEASAIIRAVQDVKRCKIDRSVHACGAKFFVIHESSQLSAEFPCALAIGDKFHKQRMYYNEPPIVLSGDCINLHLSGFGEKPLFVDAKFFPCYDYASDKYFTNFSYVAAALHSLPKLFSVCSFPDEDHKKVISQAFQYLFYNIYDSTETLSREAYNSFWNVIINTNLFDKAYIANPIIKSDVNSNIHKNIIHLILTTMYNSLPSLQTTPQNMTRFRKYANTLKNEYNYVNKLILMLFTILSWPKYQNYEIQYSIWEDIENSVNIYTSDPDSSSVVIQFDVKSRSILTICAKGDGLLPPQASLFLNNQRICLDVPIQVDPGKIRIESLYYGSIPQLVCTVSVLNGDRGKLFYESYSNFKNVMDIMNQTWSKSLDEKLVLELNEKSTEPKSFGDIPNEVVQLRSRSINTINELIETHFKDICYDSLITPLVPYSSSIITPLLKERFIEKFVHQQMGDKPILRFSRTEAALMESNPGQKNARSLFDQFVSQVIPDKLWMLKSKNSPWGVELAGEGAIDAGGPGRDLFTEVCREMFKPYNKLFILSPASIINRKDEYIPDPSSDPERLIYAGALIGLAFITKSPQKFHFEEIVWSYLLGNSMSDRLIEAMDPSFKGIDENTQRVMSIQTLSGEIVDLVKNGCNLKAPGTVWRSEAILFRKDEIRLQMRCLRDGFERIMGHSCRKILCTRELKLFITGPDSISAQDMISIMHFQNCEQSFVTMLTWTVEQLTPQERSLLLKFVTGRAVIPIGNHKEKFNVRMVEEIGKEPYMLPSALTCSSELLLPVYPEKEIMLERIRTAIYISSEMLLDTEFNASERAF